MEFYFLKIKKNSLSQPGNGSKAASPLALFKNSLIYDFIILVYYAFEDMLVSFNGIHLALDLFFNFFNKEIGNEKKMQRFQ